MILRLLAAAGSPDTGATRDELAIRTKQRSEDLNECLAAMLATGVLKEENGRYFPTDLHVLFDGKQLRNAFLAQYASVCRDAAERASKQLDNPSELYLTSFFCVRRDRLPELKKILRQTLLQFVDDSIETEGGDSIAQLLISMHE